jgi:hypothetical protein
MERTHLPDKTNCETATDTFMHYAKLCVTLAAYTIAMILFSMESIKAVAFTRERQHNS